MARGRRAEEAPEVHVTVPGDQVARIAQGAARPGRYGMGRAALLGCHSTSCKGEVLQGTPDDSGVVVVRVACGQYRCEVITGGAERLGLGIESSAKNFGPPPDPSRK